VAEFLDGYGHADAKRERIVKRIMISVVVAAILGGAGWFFFRDFPEQQQVRRFFSLLEKQDYDGAYRLWGCDPANPCRDYTKEKFLEDWGPKGVYMRKGGLEIAQKRSCENGIIQYVVYGEDEEDIVHLYVQRSDLAISFAPWPVCNPRWQAPSTP
jgi:hypothetical protein